MKENNMNEDIKPQWERCGILDGVEEESKDFVVGELEELKRLLTEELRRDKDLFFGPAIFFILVKMIVDKIPYGNVKLHMDSVLEYYRKTAGDKTEDHLDFGVMHDRIHDYLDWLSVRRSVIL